MDGKENFQLTGEANCRKVVDDGSKRLCGQSRRVFSKSSEILRVQP